jgi:hypothetical protein
MRGQRPVGAGHEHLDAGLRVGSRTRGPDAGEQVVEQLVDQVGAAGDVRVEGVGSDAEPAGDRAHGQRVGALVGGQLAGGGEHGRPAEAGALPGGPHVDNCTSSN